MTVSLTFQSSSLIPQQVKVTATLVAVGERRGRVDRVTAQNSMIRNKRATVKTLNAI